MCIYSDFRNKVGHGLLPSCPSVQPYFLLRNLREYYIHILSCIVYIENYLDTWTQHRWVCPTCIQNEVKR